MTVWIASPTGTAAGAGTVNSPRDIDSLIAATSPVAAGDTIYLRGGTYTPLTAGETGTVSINGTANHPGWGVYNFHISGTAANLITIRSYPGEWAKINGSFHMVTTNASYLRMQNIECACVPTTRVYAAESNIPTGAIYVSGSGCQFINCYFHEHHCNFFYPEIAGGTNIVHGCIMGNIGAWVPGRNPPRIGYCMYTHNLGQSPFYIEKNAFFGSVHDFNVNPHTTGGHISNYQINDNLFFGGSLELGSANALNRDNYIRRNYMYQPDGDPATALPAYGFRLTSYNNTSDPLGEEIDFEYNYLVSGGPTQTRMPFDLWARNLRGRYNTIIDRSATSVLGVVQHTVPTGAITEVIWDYNTYYTNYVNPFYSNHSGSYVRHSLAQWQADTGYDLNSTIAGVLPTTNVTKVTANDYETGRGQIAIFNWESLATVTVNIAALNIPDGARCRLNNILNYRVEYTDFTYSAASPTISIPMTGWTQGQPVAYDVPLTWHASPGSAFWMFEIQVLDTGEGLTVPAFSTNLTVTE